MFAYLAYHIWVLLLHDHRARYLLADTYLRRN